MAIGQRSKRASLGQWMIECNIMARAQEVTVLMELSVGPFLMMSADTRILDGLALIGTVADEFFRTKRGIVGVIAQDVDAAVFGPALKGILGLKCLAYAERDLIGAVDVLRRMVSKEGAAGVFLRFGLFSFGMGKSTMSGGHILVNGHLLTRLQLVLHKATVTI